MAGQPAAPGRLGRPTLAERLRSALTTAMRAGDRSLVAYLRVSLAALANAEAVPATAAPAAAVGSATFAGSTPGLGAAEVPRRQLSEAEQMTILASEIAGLQLAAQRAAHCGDAAQSADLLRVAERLAELAR